MKASANSSPSPSEGSFVASPASVLEDGVEDELAMRERELTKDVPTLLETMNRTSAELNLYERQAGEAQERYKRLLEQWSRSYEELRAQHGSNIDRVKPYFDAEYSLNEASQNVQRVIREFSAAASQHTAAKSELRGVEERLAYGAHKVPLDRDQQDGLSRATVWVVRCQQERDRREQEYAQALREYQDAQEAMESWRSQLGGAIIKRTSVWFRQLQKHQVTLATEQRRMNTFAERARAAKSVYNSSMNQLDKINVAVHMERRKYKLAADGATRSEKMDSAELPQVPPELEVPPNNGSEIQECSRTRHDKGVDAIGQVADLGPFGDDFSKQILSPSFRQSPPRSQTKQLDIRCDASEGALDEIVNNFTDSVSVDDGPFA